MSQSAGRMSTASDVRKLRGRADCVMTLLFSEECGQGRTRRHKRSCTLLRSNEALANAKLGGRCVTTAHRGPQRQTAERSNLVTECASRARAERPLRRRAQAGGHQAGCCARPTTFRRSAHEKLSPTGLLARQGGWAVLKFCWRGCSALQQSMPECACMHACLHTQSPRHPRLLSHSRSLAPSLSPIPLDMRR